MTFLGSVISHLRDKKLIDAEGEAALAKALRRQLDDIERAAKARDEVRARNAAVPADSSLPDDGFRRD
jgi:hypothetical protein